MYIVDETKKVFTIKGKFAVYIPVHDGFVLSDLDPNYDLYFYRTSQDGYAALPYPIYLSGSSFSLSVWVRFYQSSLTGTFLTIFTAK